MKNKPPSYQRHRFPSEIISHAVWLYHRFYLSFREVEELLAERDLTVTYETVRQWCRKFGPAYARKLKKRQGRLGATWQLDEVFVSIQGEQQYLWRAVDQGADTIDMLVQRRRNTQAAVRFFRRLLKGQGREPRWMFTDTLKSYGAAHRAVMPTVEPINAVYANNRVAVSHQPTRQQEYHMRGFSSATHAQRFLTFHGLTQNLFRLGRHLMQAVHYRLLRPRPFRSGRKRCTHKQLGLAGSMCPSIVKLTIPINAVVGKPDNPPYKWSRKGRPYSQGEFPHVRRRSSAD